MTLGELALIFIILILNSLIILYLKDRSWIIITLILSQLAAIIFYSLIVDDFQILRSLTIATVVYSITTFILINNSTHININPLPDLKFNWKIIATILIISIITITSGFYLVKRINKTSEIVRQKQTLRQIETEKNPLIFPGHLVHKNVKKFYLEKNFDAKELSKSTKNEIVKNKELYDESTKIKLRSNSIIKSLSDIILALTGILIAIFLSYLNKKNEV